MDDMFMATAGEGMGFELGDFAKKTSGKKSFLTWHIEEGGGSINSSPRLRGDYIYVAAMDGCLYKLDKETGKLVWKFKAGGLFCDAYPVFMDGFIYIGNYDHNFYAIEEETGKELWRFQTGDRIYGSSALVTGDMVIFTSKDYYVYSLNRRTGEIIWTFRTGGWAASTPTEHDGRILVSSSDGNMYCLDKNGKEFWRFKTGGNIFSQNRFCINEGNVYFGSDDFNVYGVRISDGREVFRYKTEGYGSTVPVIQGNVLYFCGDTNFYAIDTKTRNALWKFKMGDEKAGSKPIILGEKVIFGSADGNLYCLDKGNGRELWRFRTNGHIFGKPALDGGRIYFGSYDCHLYCIDTEGKLLWRFQTSTLNQSRYKYEEEATFEFREPEVTEEETDQDGDKYAEKKEEVAPESTYSVKSEYVFKSEYA